MMLGNFTLKLQTCQHWQLAWMGRVVLKHCNTGSLRSLCKLYASSVRQDPFYSELLQQLRGSPALVARLLLHCEQNEPAHVTQLVDTVYSGVFGSGILQEDRTGVLQASPTGGVGTGTPSVYMGGFVLAPHPHRASVSRGSH